MITRDQIKSIYINTEMINQISLCFLPQAFLVQKVDAQPILQSSLE